VAFFISGAGLHDLVAVQGDQMCLWKNRPKCSPAHFLAKFYT
jgi:hypothetical protein